MRRAYIAPRPQYNRRSMSRRFAGAAVFLLAVVSAPPAQAGTLGLAEVRTADGTLLADAGEGPFAYPADGSVATVASLAASAQTDAGARATANASGEAQTVSLFGGEITATDVNAKASAATSGHSATGNLARSSITGLTVLGQPATASANARIFSR